MPRIIADIGGFDRYAWAITSYLVCATIAYPIVGRLSDLYGRRRFLLPGMAIFIVGSALVGASGSMTVLVLFRAVQGIGGGIIMTCSYVAIADLFPPEERGKFHGLIGAVYGVASVAGPIAGGVVAERVSWHWMFVLIALSGIPVLALSARFFPKLHPPSGGDRMDYAGMLALILALLPLLVGLSAVGVQQEWTTPRIVGLLAFVLSDLDGHFRGRQRQPVGTDVARHSVRRRAVRPTAIEGRWTLPVAGTGRHRVHVGGDVPDLHHALSPATVPRTDACSDTDARDLPGTGLPMTTLADAFKSTNARTVLCILDCCFGGQAPARVFETEARPRNAFGLDGVAGEGRILLAACATRESAWEQPGTGHGLLTHATIDALSTENGETVSFPEVAGEIVRLTRVEAVRIGVTQIPVFLGSVQGGLVFPRLKRGDNYVAAFPAMSVQRLSGAFSELAEQGFPAEIVDQWTADFPGGLNPLQIKAVNEHGVLDDRSLLVVRRGTASN